jgi:TLD
MMITTKTVLAGTRWKQYVILLLVFLQQSNQAFSFAPSRRLLQHRRTNRDRFTRYVGPRPPRCCGSTTALDMAVDPTQLLQDLSPTLAPFLAGTENLDGPELAKVVPIAVATTVITAILGSPPLQLVSKSVLDSIVAGTYLERRKDALQLVYKASKDGWSAIAFHEAVDGLGSGVVVARGITGKTFGGFNPNGWRSTDDYYSSSAAFLWCLKGDGGVVKLPVLAGGNCSVFDYATSGPCFGAADLMIGLPQAAVMGGFAGPDAEDIAKSAGNLRQCKSAVGSTYDYDPAWPVRGVMQLVEVEVYCIANA